MWKNLNINEKSNVTLTPTRGILPVDTVDVAKNNNFLMTMCKGLNSET